MADEIKIVLTLDDSNLSIATQRAGQNLRQLQNTINQTVASTDKADSHFKNLSTTFRDLVIAGGLLRFVLYDIRDTFNLTLGKVIQSSAEIERMTKLMQGLSTETTNQAKALDAIKNRDFVFNMAKNAPFEVKALTDSFVKLKSAGLDPTDGTLQTLIDSVAKFGGSSMTLSRASVAIQQMAGKGVISMEELRQQLGEAVPSAIRAMAVGTGMSMAELVKQISTGSVESVSALQRMFAVLKFENDGAAAEMNKTWVGQFEKLKTNFTLFTDYIGNFGKTFGADGQEDNSNTFFGKAKAALEELNKYFESDEGKKFAADIGKSIVSLVDLLSDATKFIVKYGDSIKALAKAFTLLFAFNFMKDGLTAIGTKVKAFYDDYNTKVNSALTVERSKAAQTIAAARQELLAKQAIRANEIAADQAHYNKQIAMLQAELQVKSAQEEAYTRKFLAARQIAETGLNASGNRVRQSTIANNEAMAKNFGMLADRAAMEAARIEASLGTLAAASARTAAAMQANTAVTATSFHQIGVAAEANAARVGILSGAFNFLGGWVGLLNIALMAGVTAWAMWGDKANESAQKASEAIDAVKGRFASLQNAMDLQRSLQEKEVRAKKLDEEAERLSAPNLLDPTPDLATKTLIEQKRKEATELRAQIEKDSAYLSDAFKQGAKKAADEFTRASKETIEATVSSKETEIRASTRTTLDTIEANVKNEKDKTAQISAAVADGAKKLYNYKLEVYQQERDKYLKEYTTGVKADGKKLTDVERKSAGEAYVEFEKTIESIKGDLKNAETIGTNAKTLKRGGKTTPKLSTPIQDLIDSLKAEGEALDAEITGMSGRTSKLEYELTKTKKYWQQGTGGKASIAPSPFEVSEALGAAEYKDRLAKQLEERNRLLSESRMALERMRRIDAKKDGGLDNAFENMMGGNVKFETSNMHSLKENMADMRDALEKAASLSGPDAEKAQRAIRNWSDFFNRQVSNQGAVDAAKLAEDLRLETSKLTALNTDDDRQAKENEFQRQKEHLQKMVDFRLSLLTESDEKTNAIRLKLTEEFQANEKALIERHRREMRTPLQSMAVDWQKSTKAMMDASVNWANSTVDAIVQMVKTGKMDFSGLVDSILTDILRIQIKKNLAEPLSQALDGAVKWVSGALGFGGTGPKDATSEATKSVAALSDRARTGAEVMADMAKSIGDTTINTVQQTTASATTATALTTLASSAAIASNALAQLATSSGVSSSAEGLFSGIAGLFGSSSSSGKGGSSGASSAAGSFFTEFLDPFAFAMGGIMSSTGAFELRKYANGGIANRPQLAVFGEGRMNEAYVPLPDGRSIPVSMNGSGNGTVVNVNVIEAPGTQATVQESTDADGNMSIDVVISKVESAISQRLSKGKGNLGKTMERTYGLSRAPGAF